MSFASPEADSVRVGSLIQLTREDVFSNGLAIVALDPGAVVDPRKRWNERYNVLPFPDDLTAWFEDHPNVDATDRGSFEVGGIRMQQVDTMVTSTPDPSWPNCGGGCVSVDVFQLHHRTGPLTTSDEVGALSPGEVDRWMVADVDGRTILIDAFSANRADFRDFWPRVETVLASISFEQPS
jgi:hypothetical protein